MKRYKIKEYLKEEWGYDSIKKEVEQFKEWDRKANIPICILSHLYDKKRSKFINEMIELIDSGEQFNRDIFIFVYNDQKERYAFLDKYREINIVWIEPDNFNSTLSGKRNYIVDFAYNKKYENIFMIEDDCFGYHLPILSQTQKSKVEKNKKFMLSMNEFFDFWEYLVETKNLKLSAPLIESAFIWVLKPFKNENDYIRKGYTCIQNIHLNINFMKKNNLMYDVDSGWDDFDMNLQFILKEEYPALIPLGYHTIPLKGGLSVVDSNLEERTKRNSYKLFNKWGDEYVMIVNKRELINARINWRRIKKRNKTYKIFFGE